MKKCNYAASLADFHRNHIGFEWVLGHLCRSYGVYNPTQFGSALKHVLIQCEYPGVSELGEVFVKCARNIGGRLIGRIHAILDGSQEGNASVLYHAVAAKASTEAHHRLTCKIVLVPIKWYSESVLLRLMEIMSPVELSFTVIRNFVKAKRQNV